MAALLCTGSDYFWFSHRMSSWSRHWSVNPRCLSSQNSVVARSAAVRGCRFFFNSFILISTPITPVANNKNTFSTSHNVYTSSQITGQALNRAIEEVDLRIEPSPG
jgi:hypothetical protein